MIFPFFRRIGSTYTTTANSACVLKLFMYEVIFILGMNSKRLPGTRKINEYDLGGRACPTCNDYSFCMSSLIATHRCFVHIR
jgi:hypothetical protein